MGMRYQSASITARHMLRLVRQNPVHQASIFLVLPSSFISAPGQVSEVNPNAKVCSPCFFFLVIDPEIPGLSKADGLS